MKKSFIKQIFIIVAAMVITQAYAMQELTLASSLDTEIMTVFFTNDCPDAIGLVQEYVGQSNESSESAPTSDIPSLLLAVKKTRRKYSHEKKRLIKAGVQDEMLFDRLTYQEQFWKSTEDIFTRSDRAGSEKAVKLAELCANELRKDFKKTNQGLHYCYAPMAIGLKFFKQYQFAKASFAFDWASREVIPTTHGSAKKWLENGEQDPEKTTFEILAKIYAEPAAASKNRQSQG